MKSTFFIAIITLICVGVGWQAFHQTEKVKEKSNEQESDVEKKVGTRLTFGVYADEDPSFIYKKFQPFASYLSEELSTPENLFEVSIKIYPSYEEGRLALIEGKADFGRVGAASYVLTKKENDGVGILVGELKKGKTHFFGMIIAREDSGIKSVADLKKKSFAFGSATSTIGNYFSKSKLVEHGIFMEDLIRHKHHDRHDIVLDAVIQKQFDAGALKSSVVKKYKGKEKIIALEKFPVQTKPWVHRSGMDKKLVESIRNSLMNLKSEDVMKTLGVTGFEIVTDSDYESIRQAMMASEKFEIP